MKQKVIDDQLGTGKQNISGSFFALMFTCNYLCYSLLSQVKTVPTLPYYFLKNTFNSILNFNCVYQMPCIHIIGLIFLQVFLVLHMRTTYLNHHFPLTLCHHCFHESYRQILTFRHRASCL